MTAQTFTVDFHDHLLTTLKHEGVIFVAMRPIVEGMGLEWSGQQKKLNSQREKFSCVHIYTTGKDNKRYEMLCIPLEKLNGWLFSINPKKVRPDIRPTVELYQEECFIVLYNYWQQGEAINPRFRGKSDTFPLAVDLKERLVLIETKCRLSLTITKTSPELYPILHKSLYEVRRSHSQRLFG